MDAQDMDYLLTRLENKLKRAWRELVRAVQDDNTLAELQFKIASGDLGGLLSGVADAAEKYSLDVNGGFVAAGQKTGRWLDAQVDPAIRFDITSDSAIEWMTTHSDNLVRALVADQQAVAEHVVTLARARGLNDADIAAEVRASIGMNMRQVDAVESYRAALSTGDYRNAIDRILGDARYDAALERADQAGTFIAPNRIDAMVDAYRDNMVEARGEGYAVAESEEAIHAGVEEMIDQAVEADELGAPGIIRRWNTKRDAKVRASHRRMEGQVRGYGETFRSGLGNDLRYPGDEDAPDEDTAGCRCHLTYSLLA